MSALQAIFASTSGNVEFVVESVCDRWKEWQVNANLHRAEVTSIETVKQHQFFLLATSTWEHGVINPFFNTLLRELHQLDCSGKRAFFIGCGDTRYEPVYFCEGMKELRRVFEAQGGQTLGQPLLINGSPYDQSESVIIPWAEAQYEIIRSYA